MRRRTSVKPSVTKAISMALAYRDFSGWRRKEKSGFHTFVFELELGSGYTLYAYPKPDFIVGSMTFDIMYEGAYSLCFRGEFESIGPECLRLRGDDAWATIQFDFTVHPHEYARSVKDSVCKKRIRYTTYTGGERDADIYYSGLIYGGCRKRDKNPKLFSWDFKKNLMKATFMQDFSGIEQYTDDYCVTEAGLDFGIQDTEEVMYSTRYRIAVGSGDEDTGPVRFGFNGTFTRDSDGILIRGDSAALTIPISKEEMKKFRKETEFPTPEEYLAEHPFVSYKHYTEKYSDQIPEFAAEDEDRW